MLLLVAQPQWRVEMADITPNIQSKWRAVPLVAWKINMGDRQATLSNGSRMDGQKSKTNDDGGTDALAVQCEREEEASNDCDTFIERKRSPARSKTGQRRRRSLRDTPPPLFFSAISKTNDGTQRFVSPFGSVS